MKFSLIFLIVIVISFGSMAQSVRSWKVTDVEKYIDSSSARVLVINFWASFCKPCVAEIPSFISITDKYKSSGVRLLLVSLDLPSWYPKRIRDFAVKNHFNTNIVWLNETDADYFIPKINKDWGGSIPATLMLNTKTGKRAFFEEEISASDFEKNLNMLLDDNP
jgi:thiol-disulfide isomerase/thioredoxin